MATKTEDGVEFPAGDYCYVGDPEVVSTWKLRVTSTPGGDPDPAIVGAAAAALGPGGFRGQQVDIPDSERPAAVACVRAAWRKAHPEMDAAAMPPGIQERAEPEAAPVEDLVVTEIADGELEVRSVEKRELGAIIAPWDTVVDTPIGLESFRRGSFGHVDPKAVVLRLGHDGPPVGRGIALEERAEGAYMAFRVSKTQRGDEALTLAADGVTRHVSIEYDPRTSTAEVGYRNGKRVTELTRVGLKGVATTYAPYYERAEVLFVRDKEGTAPMADQEAPVAGAPTTPEAPAPVIDMTPVTASIAALESRFAERFAQLEERSRANFIVPSATPESDTRAKRGDWMSAVIRMLSGEHVNDLQMRALADLVTSDNVGVVPDAYQTEIIGVIDPSRPFMQSTRKLDLPAAGMSLVVPKIVTRPTAGVQAVYGDESSPEKSEITSTATSITNVSYDAVTVAGGGDIGLQLLKRSSPSYLSLYLELLAEAYGVNCEAEALATLVALVGTPGGVNDGGTLDPENLILGGAWSAGAAVHKPINTMWLSSAAVGAFIDAKASTTNAPLYSTIQAGFTAGVGTGGTISGLKPVWVPALDTAGVDVLVGPSSGFGWTEDGTYTLQVDVPAKAGRDVALVGIIWLAPMYPTAFTAYGLTS